MVSVWTPDSTEEQGSQQTERLNEWQEKSFHLCKSMPSSPCSCCQQGALPPGLTCREMLLCGETLLLLDQQPLAAQGSHPPVSPGARICHPQASGANPPHTEPGSAAWPSLSLCSDAQALEAPRE